MVKLDGGGKNANSLLRIRRKDYKLNIIYCFLPDISYGLQNINPLSDPGPSMTGPIFGEVTPRSAPRGQNSILSDHCLK